MTMHTTHYLLPNWPAPANIKAYTTTRRIAGFSEPPFASFNLGDHVGEAPEITVKNREKLMHDLSLPESPFWLRQIHGTHVVSIDHCEPNPEADACFARLANKVCVIMVADCLPILICNRAGTEIAAIHAGWRGLLTGVIENTLRQLYTKPNELLAWLGPAIGPTHFEINNEIRQAFLQKNTSFEPYFFLKDNERWFADLFQLARASLAQQGVTAVYGGDHCTYSDSQNFYSYRRDNKITGRMASLIWMQQ